MAWSNPVLVSAKVPRHTSLDRTMSEIRIWLDSEKIQAAAFKTVVSREVWALRSNSTMNERHSGSKSDFPRSWLTK
jgi:hypothetical protein